MRRRMPTAGRVSLALILSYVVDWVVILLAAGLGAAFSVIHPNRRPFTLANPEIAFPFVAHEKVSTAVLALCSLAGPAAVIMVVCLLCVPGPTVPRCTPTPLIWRRKLWEWHTGWLGLALSLAAAFVITNGMKNLFGKPRPDLLSRCNPDVANVERYAVGGFPQTPGGSFLVSAAICRQTDLGMLDDGFRSYPSGHASFSAAGLIYLSLFLASKLAITIPFLATSAHSTQRTTLSAFPSRVNTASASTPPRTPASRATGTDKTHDETTPTPPLSTPSGHNDTIIGARHQAAAPPVYLLVFAAIPFFTSIYIASTRYSDFRHHGFDILFGYVIGAATALLAFRYYHLPINQGAGWSWGPRSPDRSFWAGVGVGSYAGGKKGERRAEGGADAVGAGGQRDVELGPVDVADRGAGSRRGMD